MAFRVSRPAYCAKEHILISLTQSRSPFRDPSGDERSNSRPSTLCRRLRAKFGFSGADGLLPAGLLDIKGLKGSADGLW